MSNERLEVYLQGGDLRSIAQVEKLLYLIKTQSDFDDLFQYLFSKDRLIIMRAADAVEKVSAINPQFLSNHKSEILNFLDTAVDKEFKWHLALMVSRLDLKNEEIGNVWNELTKWAKNKKESRIVRVNSIQSLFDIATHHKKLKTNLMMTLKEIKTENIPSINARVKKLEKE